MPRLTAADIIEAEIIAAHMICCRVREFDVRKELRNGNLKLSRTQAAKVVNKVIAEQRAIAKKSREEMLSQAYATLDEATQMAFKKSDVRAVVAVERLRAEISGLIGSDAHVPTPEQPESWCAQYQDDEEAMHCYGTMGKWPNELTAAERDRYAVIQKMEADAADESAVQSSSTLH